MAMPRPDSGKQPPTAQREGPQSVLIVTASAPTQRMYAEYLGWRGVSVREVTSAAAALDHLSACTPDIIVIEDRIEDGRGVDLVLTLRRSSRTSHVPIALLSSDVFGMSPLRAHRFGCDLLVAVPCLPAVLFDALVQLVRDGSTPRRPEVIDSWLFVRDDESVQIVRNDLALTVYANGHRQRIYRFSSELDLSTFQADYEHDLVHGGFTFQAFREDRRRPRRRTRRAVPKRSLRPRV
jgi:CheY-like chemotaxis protein